MEEALSGFVLGALLAAALTTSVIDIAWRHDVHACMVQNLSVQQCNDNNVWNVK